jgi:hypothetical protein
MPPPLTPPRCAPACVHTRCAHVPLSAMRNALPLRDPIGLVFRSVPGFIFPENFLSEADRLKAMEYRKKYRSWRLKANHGSHGEFSKVPSPFKRPPLCPASHSCVLPLAGG